MSESVQPKKLESLIGEPPKQRLEDMIAEPPMGSEPQEFRPTQIGLSGAMGAGIGAFTPEIMRAGGAALSGAGRLAMLVPPLEVPGLAMAGVGAGMTAAAPFVGRVGPAISGLIGGLGGETAGQTVEALSGPGMGAEAARFAGGMATGLPGVVRSLATKLGTKVTGVPIKTLTRELLAKSGLDPSKMTSAQLRQYEQLVQAEVAKISPDVGPMQGYPHAERLYSILQDEAKVYERLAQGQISREEANTLLAQAEAQFRRGEAATLRAQLGTPREATDVGRDIREGIVGRFEPAKLARSEEYVAQMAARDADVAAKEGRGVFMDSMSSYQEALTDLNKLLLRGKEGLEQPMRDVAEEGVRSAYSRIQQAMTRHEVQIFPDAPGKAAEEAVRLKNMGLKVRGEMNPETGETMFFRVYPTSFQAIDDVRRKLGDAAFGRAAEGYEGLKQSVARDWYTRLSNMQTEFAGESQQILQSNYELASKFLQPFKGKAGGQALAIDRFDPERYVRDPAALPRDYFKTQQTVSDLLTLTDNPELVRKTGTEYVAKNLVDKTGEQAAAWVKRNSDWLAHPEMRAVRDQAEMYAARLQAAHTAESAATAAGAALPRKVDQALKIAENRTNMILGSKDAPARVREMILGDDLATWNMLGPIVTRSQEGQKIAADAISEVFAYQALRTSPQAALQSFSMDVAPRLVQRGIMSKAAAEGLEQQLQNVVRVSKDGPPTSAFGKLVISNFLRSYLGFGAARAAYENAPSREQVQPFMAW